MVGKFTNVYMVSCSFSLGISLSSSNLLGSITSICGVPYACTIGIDVSICLVLPVGVSLSFSAINLCTLVSIFTDVSTFSDVSYDVSTKS